MADSLTSSDSELTDILKSVRYAQRVIAGIEKRRNGKPNRDQILNDIAANERNKTLAKIDSNISQALYKIGTLRSKTNGLLCERVFEIEELSAFINKVNVIKEKMIQE